MSSPDKEALRQEVGAAMLEFVQTVMDNQSGPKDDVLRQVATDNYRRKVLEVAAKGFEHSLIWHTLGMWTEEGDDRIGCFSRALDCVRLEKAALSAIHPAAGWVFVHTEAECLYEIARVHVREGTPEVAREFLEEALPLAREADALREPDKFKDDFLEGKIAALLLQL
jgi:hypothetical protein